MAKIASRKKIAEKSEQKANEAAVEESTQNTIKADDDAVAVVAVQSQKTKKKASVAGSGFSKTKRAGLQFSVDVVLRKLRLQRKLKREHHLQ